MDSISSFIWMLDTHSSSSFEQMRDEFQFHHFSSAHQLSRPCHGHGRPVPGNAKNMTRRRNKCSTRETREKNRVSLENWICQPHRPSLINLLLYCRDFAFKVDQMIVSMGLIPGGQMTVIHWNEISRDGTWARILMRFYRLGTPE